MKGERMMRDVGWISLLKSYNPTQRHKRTVSFLDFRLPQNLFRRNHAPMPNPTSNIQIAATGMKVIAMNCDCGASLGATFVLSVWPSTSLTSGASEASTGRMVLPRSSFSSSLVPWGWSFVVLGLVTTWGASPNDGFSVGDWEIEGRV